MVHGNQVDGPTGPVFPQGVFPPSALPDTLGLKGAPGCPGAVALDGFHGTRGPPGPTGPRGDTGDRGQRGERGERGEQGERGDRGQRGNSGEPGERGPQGATGPVGPSGPIGPARSTGTVDVAVLNIKMVLMEARLAALESKLASEERDRDRIDRIGQSISGLVDELGTFRIGLHVGGTWNQDLHHKLGALQRKMSTLTEKM